VNVDYFLHANMSLSTSPPVTAGQISFPYAPSDPSPTTGGLTMFFGLDLFHGPIGQEPVVERPDAIVFQSNPLNECLLIQGRAQITLQVSTDRNDTDFAVRLVDIFPNGTLFLLGDGIRRLKLRDSFTTPQLAEPGTVYSVDVKITNTLAYRVDAGHRVGIIITSSNYPRYDRNPNTGANFFRLVAPHLNATNSVHILPAAPSKLTLPVALNCTPRNPTSSTSTESSITSTSSTSSTTSTSSINGSTGIATSSGSATSTSDSSTTTSSVSSTTELQESMAGRQSILVALFTLLFVILHI
jgi:putative CocE/NonD family hydrolase